MARQVGLGKSLHEVLESLKPAESWPEAPRLAREQLEHELDQLLEDVQALRERVQELTAKATGKTKTKTKSKATGKTKPKSKSKAKSKGKAKGGKKKRPEAKSDESRRAEVEATMPERPIDDTPRHTDDLPPTPVRDRTIPAGAWIEAPATLLSLGDDIDEPTAAYKRRIGRWLLWRAGPASRGHAHYMAIDSRDLTRQVTFRLWPDGHGTGIGPDSRTHDRFRAWKESLRDSG
jgi:hypothetical protein